MWKKYAKISVMFGLFFLVFGLGVFLPDRLFAIADEKRETAKSLDNTTPVTLPDAEQAAIEKKSFISCTTGIICLLFIFLNWSTTQRNWHKYRR